MSDREVKEFIELTNPFQEGLLGEIQNYAYENDIPIISREASGFISLLLNHGRVITMTTIHHVAHTIL